MNIYIYTHLSETCWLSSEDIIISLMIFAKMPFIFDCFYQNLWTLQMHLMSLTHLILRIIIFQTLLQNPT